MNFLNRYPKSKIWLAKRYLDSPKNRADLYVTKIQNFILNKMNENDWTYEKFGKEIGVTKSAVSQMLNSDSSIKLNTIFKFLDGLNQTLELPKIVESDINSLCEDYLAELNTVELQKNISTNTKVNTTDLRLYVSNINDDSDTTRVDLDNKNDKRNENLIAL